MKGLEQFGKRKPDTKNTHPRVWCMGCFQLITPSEMASREISPKESEVIDRTLTHSSVRLGQGSVARVYK